MAPYFDKMQYRDLQDVKQGFADLRGQTDRYAQQEAKSYKELLDRTKKQIRKG